MTPHTYAARATLTKPLQRIYLGSTSQSRDYMRITSSTSHDYQPMVITFRTHKHHKILHIAYSEAPTHSKTSAHYPVTYSESIPLGDPLSPLDYL